jgi:alpha-L-fucosidase 2
MKQIKSDFTFLVFLDLFLSVLPIQAGNDGILKLRHSKPASIRNEAFLIGNERLGAMIYGNPAKEVVQLNENTVWAEHQNRNENLNAKEALPEVRKRIFEGRYKEVQNLINKNFISKISHEMHYQTVDNLKTSFPGHENYFSYYRELGIENTWKQFIKIN